MRKTNKKATPGQKLWRGLYYADQYDQDAETIIVPPGAPRYNAERATRSWCEGMSRHLKESFPARFRKQREELGVTQQKLADIAQLTVTAVAMFERGERAPSLDTSQRLCMALDVAAGVLPDPAGSED
jgi:DNA-binding XRE family transcriptional regulator